MKNGRRFLMVVVAGLAARSLTALEPLHVMFVPVAAHLPSTDEKVWESDLRLYNASARDAAVSLAFLPAGTDNANVSETPVNLPAGRAVLLDDVVQKTFGVTGYGGIRVRSSVALLASSATYLATPNPGHPGVSVAPVETIEVPVLDEIEATSGAARALFVSNRFDQIEAGPDYRSSFSNVGLLNPMPSGSIQVVLTLTDQQTNALLGTTTLELPPYGFIQIVDVFDVLGASAVRTANAILMITSTRGGSGLPAAAPVIAYATRQMLTLGGCGERVKQADFLIAKALP